MRRQVCGSNWRHFRKANPFSPRNEHSRHPSASSQRRGWGRGESTRTACLLLLLDSRPRTKKERKEKQKEARIVRAGQRGGNLARLGSARLRPTYIHLLRSNAAQPGKPDAPSTSTCPEEKARRDAGRAPAARRAPLPDRLQRLHWTKSLHSLYATAASQNVFLTRPYYTG